MQDSGHVKFVCFIEKLTSNIGINKMLTGHVNHTPSPSKETTNEEVTVRAWLAAEILCTWKWPGGSAQASFLPILSAYASSSYPSQESLVDTIFNILLDGALVHGGCDAWSSVNLLLASSDEVEAIKEPFLRALVSFLSTLFKDYIWGADKARLIFELLVNKLYIGEAININCLRILPLVVNVLIQSLSHGSTKPAELGTDDGPNSSENNYIQDAIAGWLQKAIDFSPIVVCQNRQGKCSLLLQLNKKQILINVILDY